ncbi:MAG: Uma2 family endonuclease [Pseudomonadota bacterium]|nr:Uma2 family endonuclease [Pseudomonadota bacterium]
MTVDEFLVWAEGREGKWELRDGAPCLMAPERIRHTIVKTNAAIALANAVRRAGVRCLALSEGVTVRISAKRAFVPDASILCPPPGPDDIETTNPVVVVEVLSPATAAFDHGAKLEGYFSLASLAHYLLVDPDRRVLIHHSRGREGVIETRILHDGAVRLDPPGVAFDMGELFGD